MPARLNHCRNRKTGRFLCSLPSGKSLFCFLRSLEVITATAGFNKCWHSLKELFDKTRGPARGLVVSASASVRSYQDLVN